MIKTEIIISIVSETEITTEIAKETETDTIRVRLHIHATEVGAGIVIEPKIQKKEVTSNLQVNLFGQSKTNSAANSTVLHEQQEAIPTTQSSFLTPPEWKLLERQEEEDKRNEQSRLVHLTDNSRNRNNDSRRNDNITMTHEQ